MWITTITPRSVSETSAVWPSIRAAAERWASGQVLQYHPAIRKLKELVDAGDLGDIQCVYSNRLNLGKIRHEENLLWSFAPHDISVILLLRGRLPKSVATTGESWLREGVADVTMTTLEFERAPRP